MWARGGKLQPMRYDSSLRVRSGRQCVSLAGARAPSTSAALLEVWRVVRIVGVCGPLDFDMAFDGRAGGCVERKHLALALFLGEPDAEDPSFARRREVLASLPGSGFVGMASFGPAP